jgi:hypothetical protein
VVRIQYPIKSAYDYNSSSSTSPYPSVSIDQSNPEVGGGASLRTVGAEGPPPNMDDSMSPKGFAACCLGGGMAKYRVEISCDA